VLSSIGWVHALGWFLARRGSRVLAIVPAILGAVIVGFGARLTGTIPTVAGAAIGGALGLVGGAWWAGLEVGGRRLPGTVTTEPGRDGPDRESAATSGRWTASLALVAVATMAIASLSLAGHALGNRESATSTARAAAVARATSWIEANVPPGTPIGFGSFLGYETAVDLAGRYPMVQIHQSLAVVDPSAPLGLAQFGAS